MDTLEYTEYSLYSIVIIAYFLLAFYFMYVKFRHNKTQFYWVFISLMFLALGISRILFQVHYFYVPTLEGKMSNLSLVRTFLGFYVVATLFTWMGIISLMGWMGILVFRYDGKFFIKRREKKTQEGSKDELAQQVQVLQKQIEILESKQSGEKQEDSDLEATKSLTDFKKKKIVSLKKGGQEQGKDKLVVALRLIIIVVILALVLPILLGPVFRDENMSQLVDPNLLETYNVYISFENAIVIGTWRYPVGRFLLNFVLLPFCITIVPFYFLYLAKKNTGIKRTSYLLNFLGFILYMAGRITQGLFNAIGSYALEAILPPLLILVSLFALYWANHYKDL